VSIHSPLCRPLRSRQRGLAAVEAAILLPLLLFLMMATAEVGRYIYTYNALTKMVEAGARYLSQNAYLGTTRVLDVDTNAAKKNVTGNIVVYGNIAGSGTALIQGLTAANVAVAQSGDDAVQVEIVNFQYSPMFASRLAFFGGNGLDLRVPMSAGVVMRALN